MKLFRPRYLAAMLCLIALPVIANAQQISFDLAGRAGAGLLPGNENPEVTNSSASGDANSIIFDTASNQLTLDVVWGSGNGFGDLTGNATAMHIHGPADEFSNGGVLYNLGVLGGFDASASDGGFSGAITIDAADVQSLLDGNLYINIHTSTNAGGELRANLIQAIPEPGSLALLSVAGMGMVLGRRNRRRQL